MSDSTETLVKYYDAISKADLEKICESFDIPSKLISLYDKRIKHFQFLFPPGKNLT